LRAQRSNPARLAVPGAWFATPPQAAARDDVKKLVEQVVIPTSFNRQSGPEGGIEDQPVSRLSLTISNLQAIGPAKLRLCGSAVSRLDRGSIVSMQTVDTRPAAHRPAAGAQRPPTGMT
jgi:hypothetical protein